MRKLQEQESSVSKLLVQENTQMQNLAKSIKVEEAALRAIEKKLAKSQKSVGEAQRLHARLA